MAEEEEVDKYKRLFEEQKARVKELERQNSQLKDVIQQLMAVGRQGNSNNSKASSLTPAAAATAASVTGSNNNATDTRVAGGGRGGGGGQRNSARTRPGGAGGRTGRGNGAANQRGSQANSEKVGQDASSTAAAGAAAAVIAARAAKAAEPAQPIEPDVRGEIVALMREASMSKDAVKLEEAINKAEKAGLHFEANQGRRQLGRITG